MDKFGYIRGRRGPAGPRGKNAVELHTWCPIAMVKMFRENENCTYFFDTATDGIIEESGKPALKDRYGKNHAACIQNYQKPMKLRNGIYGLPLKNTKFKVPNIDSQGLAEKSIFVVAFSFKVISPLDTAPAYIFSNKSGNRAVSINNKQLDIWGATASPQLEYKERDWNVMLLQYSRITDAGKDKCFFILNGKVGSFEPKVYAQEQEDFYIGGTLEQKTAPVMLASFETYSKEFFNPIEDYLLPKQIYTPLMDYLEDRAP